MKTIAAIGLAVGLATTVHAQTRLEYQVSQAGTEDWKSSLDVAPGTTVDIRARLSYIGTQTALGLGSVIFQPTVSNWLTSDAFAGIPTFGSVPDAPGVYGRISPFDRVNSTSTPNYIGHVNTVSGANYLRIALPHVTSWFGGSGNTTGGSGIIIGQLNRDNPSRGDAPPFLGQTDDIVVLKFQITVGAATDLRTLLVDTPINGFGNRQTSGVRTGNWFADYIEPTGSIREAAFAVPASINVVPAPASLALLGIAALSTRRRRPAR